MRRQSGLGLLGALLLIGACARQPPPSPPLRATPPSDIFLAPRSQIIEALVPPHATLDGLLRAHDSSASLVHAAVQSAGSVFNLRQLRQNQPYRLVRSLDGLLEVFEYQIDTDRFLRIATRDRSRPQVLDAAVLPYEKDTTVAAIRGVIDAEHPSLIAAMDRLGRDDHAGHGAGRHLQRSDRFRQ